MTNDHPLPLTPEEVERRIAAAEKEVSALCRGVRKWRMTVPVEQDDSDIVFVNLIEAAQQLLAARSDRDELDAAWREAEAALREYVARTEDEDDADGFGIRLDGDAGGYNAYARDWVTDETLFDHSTQPTPAAALRALAARLSSQGTT